MIAMRGLRRGKLSARRFAKREDGGMMVLSMIFFALMVMCGGMAVDLMRYENKRTELQQTLDRSILAAASLKQQRDPEVVVEDYFTKAGLIDYLNNVDASDEALDSRGVYADASAPVDTFFMQMLDIPSITAVAAGQAEESVSNIEISLVIDISGSMREGGKGTEQITKLRAAAKNFFSQVLDDDSADTTSINVIPYAGSVNVGPKLFNLLGGTRTHGNSSCLELTDADFNTTGKPGTGRSQVPHFMKWAIAKDYMDWGWCPQDKSAIVVAQNDLAKLNKFIDDIRLHDGTGTMTGTKYGLMLLDPTLNSVFASLASTGDIADEFSDRPLAWQTSVGSDVTKYLIVMTDGQITDQFRPRYTAFRDPDTDSLDNEKIKNGQDSKKKDILVDDPDKVDGTDHPAWNATVELDNQPADIRGSTLSSRATNLTRFYAQCNLAKQKGVIVYTIAFNAPADAKTEMQRCAHPEGLAVSSSNYFQVSSVGANELDGAFQTIARNIKQLRLTQ
jgi:Flp pilus assembly protein TadG